MDDGGVACRAKPSLDDLDEIDAAVLDRPFT